MTTLGIFVKQPVPGVVKTRLGAVIGMDAAARVARAFQRDVVTRAAEFANIAAFASQGDSEKRNLHDGSTRSPLPPAPSLKREGEKFAGSQMTRIVTCRVVPAVAPGTDAALSYFREEFPGPLEFWPQPDTDLGSRLAAFFERYCDGLAPVVVIGSDSPDLPIDFIRQAIEQLQHCDCVLGPAEDGGYYLVGLNAPHVAIFRNVDWSTSRVLEQTLANVKSAGLCCSLLPVWSDVDTLGDLRRLADRIAHERAAGRLERVPLHTEQMFQELGLIRPV